MRKSIYFSTKKEQDAAVEWLKSRLRNQRTVSPLNLKDDYVCYASKANSLVIRSSGDIAKCTVALTDKRNSIGHLNRDGTVEINQDLLRLWLRGLQSGNSQELSCPYGAMNAPDRDYSVKASL